MLEISASENVKKELDEAHAMVEELKKEMQTNAEQANADLALMKQKVSMLETQGEEEGSKIVELRSHLEAVELQRLSEISASENVKKELDEAHAMVEELKKEMQTNTEQANADLALMKQKVSMLETQCEEEGNKIVELRSHLEAAELQRMLEISASENVKKELDEAHATVEELKKEVQTNAEQANVDLALMKQKVSMLETQCEEEGNKIMELRSHLEAAELQRMLEISASENVKKELDEAHATVEELKKEMQTNAEQANVDLALMKQKVSMLETHCEELHKKDVEIIELRSCLEGLELQIVNHASEISASEKLKKELDEARARVEELQKEVQTNAKQANIELLMMKEKVSMLETQCEELNEKDVEIMELRSHLEVVELERGNLTLEIFANEKLKKELDEARTNVEELQKEMETNAEKGNVELSVMIQKVSMLEIQCEELHEKNVEITKLKSHLKALEIQNMNQALEIFASEKLKKELDYAHARIEELQREVQTNVEQANIKLSTTKQKVSMLETQCEEEQSKITELRSCLEGLELRNKNQALEISTSLKLKEELEEAHATRVEELQKEMQTNVEQANVELSMTKHKVSMLETQCEEKGCKIEELGSHLASLELQNRNQALEISKVQELKKELEEAHVAMVEELQKEMQTNVEQANVELSMTKQKVSMLETQCQEKRCKIEELGSHLEGLELQSKNQTLEIFARQKLQKDLEEAHGTRIEELQKEMRTNVEQANAKLSMMKQKVSMLETQCKEKGSKIEELKSHIEVLELQNKNHTLEISTWQKLTKELEEAHVAVVEELQKEVVGLQHIDKELERKKIELNEQLLATENKLAHHFEMEKEDHEAKPKENIVALRHVNEDLIKQVEGLQSSRFSEVEELVYLRWVNACLRHELHNHQTTLARVSALDLNKSSSLESVEKAKQLMLEYIGSNLVALQAKDHIDTGHESSFSEKSVTFSENNGDDNDIPSISGHIPRKQSFIRRLRNWTTRHLEVGTNVSSNFVSPLESEKWSHFHFDPKHRQQNIIGTKVPKETTTRIHRHASDMTLSKETTTDIHKPTSDMTSIGIASPMGGKKFDANAMKSSSSYPRRTTSDSTVLVETTIMEDDDNPLNGLVATSTLRPMARSLAFKVGENPSIKDKHNEARDREKEIKEKAKAKREKIRKEKMQAEKAIELQPSTPQQVEGMSLAQVEKTTSKIMPKPPPKPLGPLEQHGLSLSSIKSQGPPLWNGIPTTPSPPHSKANSTLQLQTKDNNMQRVPEVVELYMSLMKNEDARENENLFLDGAHDVHNNTINEIDDRSTHRLAIKADVETLGEFVQTLATEVRMAIYYNIDDVVAFVNWLDEELSLLGGVKCKWVFTDKGYGSCSIPRVQYSY
ncbi:hypothetical protein CY35_19G036000 [Sphagnum magellanicum]|nr:hypothetical protein CY35_19G036000 [Sphagnum magellanicum]